ncbi:MAG: flavodoxin family protein [Acetatifactor sp.]|nr:flavodoxin family protein [Acetatifactor sp.]
MKVLLLNGSANQKGCTYTALEEIGRTLQAEGIDYEIFQIGGRPVRDCIGCGQCTEQGCVFTDDLVNTFVQKAREADGFVFGTPVYYAHASGRILSFLDRAFYSSKDAFIHKPAAAVASARRAGTTASLDDLNKYFGISHMPTVGSSYWNMVHGNRPEEVLQDAEGLQTMRNIAHNMAWLLKCIEAGRGQGITPQVESGNWTNFIR